MTASSPDSSTISRVSRAPSQTFKRKSPTILARLLPTSTKSLETSWIGPPTLAIPAMVRPPSTRPSKRGSFPPCSPRSRAVTKRLEAPTSGEILIGGKLVNDLSPRDRRIAMVFQSYALYPHLSVYKNIAFPLKAQNLKKELHKEKVEWAASLLGIGALLDRKPRELSGGERQRVALARAIVREPAVFLLDEPLSNLDAKLRASAREELERFHRRVSTTTIYVTHDQVEAMAMGDRVLVLNKGVVHQLGTPTDVYDHPADTFVATFLGSPPMNLAELGDVIVGFRPASRSKISNTWVRSGSFPGY